MGLFYVVSLPRSRFRFARSLVPLSTRFPFPQDRSVWVVQPKRLATAGAVSGVASPAEDLKKPAVRRHVATRRARIERMVQVRGPR